MLYRTHRGTFNITINLNEIVKQKVSMGLRAAECGNHISYNMNVHTQVITDSLDSFI